jgi:hypothetical protein
VVPEKTQWPRKSAVEFYAVFPKNGRNGAKLFEVAIENYSEINFQNWPF